jgi:hypothetical protein
VALERDLVAVVAAEAAEDGTRTLLDFELLAVLDGASALRSAVSALLTEEDGLIYYKKMSSCDGAL